MLVKSVYGHSIALGIYVYARALSIQYIYYIYAQ